MDKKRLVGDAVVRIKGLPETHMGLSVYINTKEAPNERPHVHFGRGGRKSETDPKIWLDTLELSAREKSLQKFKMHEVREMLRFVKMTRKLCQEQWDRIHPAAAKRRRKNSKKP